MASRALAVADPVELAPELDPATEQDRLLEASRVILARLQNLTRESVTAKQPIEERWIRNIRQYLGIYEPDKHAILLAAKQSTAFVKLTRHKTNGWAARISDLLFPTDNKNWGISPTPIPHLTGKAKEAEQAAIEKVKQANAAAEQGDPSAAQIAAQAGEFADLVKSHYAAIDEAKRRATWMERTIEDQLVEADYVTQARDVIEDGCKLGSGVLKGPMTMKPIHPKWSEVPALHPQTGQQLADAEGKPKTRWALEDDGEDIPGFVRVNPFFFFPDMSATTIKEAEFTFELSLPSRKDLKRSARKFGFSKAAVGRLLEQGPPMTIDSVLTRLKEIRSLTGESEDIKGRYLQWEYNGPLECDEICALLRSLGRDDEAAHFEKNKDPFEEYRVIMWFIGEEVLNLAPEYPLDTGDGLYSVWNFEKGEASIFGYGVPEILSDSQSSLNNAWRMMQDNGALSVGPQLVFDKGAIVPQDGNWGMRPLKIWLRSSTSYASPTNKPFDVFDVPNNQTELAGLITLAKQFADEEAAMPDIAQGEQGQGGQTMGGMSMLFNSANVVFRRVVKSWDDDLTKPTLRRAFDWNMQFNKDESIKGDMSIDARGTSVLLVREIQSQNLMAIISNFPNNGPLAPYIKIRDTLEKTFQTMMIPPEDVLYTQDEVDKKQQEAAQAQQGQPAPPDPASEVKLQIAQMQQQGLKDELAAKKEIAQLELDTAKQISQQRTDAAHAQIQSRAEVDDKKIQSGERMKAADIAVEKARQAQGVDPGKGIG